jgi:hypothetical protein
VRLRGNDSLTIKFKITEDAESAPIVPGALMTKFVLL